MEQNYFTILKGRMMQACWGANDQAKNHDVNRNHVNYGAAITYSQLLNDKAPSPFKGCKSNLHPLNARKREGGAKHDLPTDENKQILQKSEVATLENHIPK